MKKNGRFWDEKCYFFSEKYAVFVEKCGSWLDGKGCATGTEWWMLFFPFKDYCKSFFRLFEKLFILLQMTDNADEPMEELTF